MRAINCFFLTVFSVLITTGVTAQAIKADAILDKTAQIFAKWGGMEVRFSAHIYSGKNGVSERFEGTIRTKNNKILFSTPDMIIWFDGVTQWSYMPRIEEVNIDTPSDDDLRLLNPMMILQDYKKEYNLSLIGESTSSNAKSSYDIALTPKKKGEIEKIEMQIEKHSSLPVKIVLSMRNDLRNTIQITEIKAGNDEDEVFSFPKASYPDVEIIDLR